MSIEGRTKTVDSFEPDEVTSFAKEETEKIEENIKEENSDSTRPHSTDEGGRHYDRSDCRLYSRGGISNRL